MRTMLPNSARSIPRLSEQPTSLSISSKSRRSSSALWDRSRRTPRRFSAVMKPLLSLSNIAKARLIASSLSASAI